MMIKNSLVASIEFYYRGEKYSPSARIDLDSVMADSGGLPPLYDLIARQNGIDPYSYQYEVMQMEEIGYSDVKGFVAEFIHNGELDVQGFVDKWHEEKMLADLAAVALSCMGIDDLAREPQLTCALKEAYQMGLNAAVMNRPE